MKSVSDYIIAMPSTQIELLESNGTLNIVVEDTEITIELADVEILSKDIKGYKVANEGKITVALDIEISSELKLEGIARELISKLQALRKESHLEVTDKINLVIEPHNYLNDAINAYKAYICTEILANEIKTSTLSDSSAEIEVDEHRVKVQINKAN